MNYECALPVPVEGRSELCESWGALSNTYEGFRRNRFCFYTWKNLGGALAPSAPPVPPPLLHKEAKE